MKKNAWMTSDTWTNWLKKVDNLMRCKKRQIVILCDNCAAHSSDVRLTNIKLVYLAPNTTSLIQPMDQGIIANFKRHYRSLVLWHLIADIDASDAPGTHAAELPPHAEGGVESCHFADDRQLLSAGRFRRRYDR